MNILFKNLVSGSIFKYNDGFYMRCSVPPGLWDSNYNAVRLQSGEFDCFGAETPVALQICQMKYFSEEQHEN